MFDGSGTGTALRAAQLPQRTPLDDTVESAPGQARTDDAGGRPLSSVTGPPMPWFRRYRAALVATDVVAASAAALIALVARFGPQGTGMIAVLAFIVALPLAWVAVLAGCHAYERRIVGAGAVEYQRLLQAFLYLTALVTFVSYVVHVEMSRGFVLLALPLTAALDLVGRFAVRKLLHHRRHRGGAMTALLAVGEPEAIADFARLIRQDVSVGMRIVGACVPSHLLDDRHAQEVLAASGVEVCGDIDSVHDAALACGAHTVAVLATRGRTEKLRWVSAQLEGTEIDLVVSPGLTEIAGRRLHVQPAAGLPLVYVDVPRFSGGARFVKAVFDRVVAAAALLILLPALVVLALIVRCTSHGPALFRQTRVGRGGRTFTMLKFRSMYDGAELRVSELLERNDSTGGVLFKLREDPRVTPIGRVLRRFSLDELPQLVNVLTGSMSLVGPRPPLPDEVSRYGDDARRRLLVKPGLTGLWQISGRSDLSWEDSIRLDLRYVENWSLALDTAVLVKTARAVFEARGAY